MEHNRELLLRQHLPNGSLAEQPAYFQSPYCLTAEGLTAEDLAAVGLAAVEGSHTAVPAVEGSLDTDNPAVADSHTVGPAVEGNLAADNLAAGNPAAADQDFAR